MDEEIRKATRILAGLAGDRNAVFMGAFSDPECTDEKMTSVSMITAREQDYEIATELISVLIADYADSCGWDSETLFAFLMYIMDTVLGMLYDENYIDIRNDLTEADGSLPSWVPEETLRRVEKGALAYQQSVQQRVKMEKVPSVASAKDPEWKRGNFSFARIVRPVATCVREHSKDNRAIVGNANASSNVVVLSESRAITAEQKNSRTRGTPDTDV